MKPKLTKCWMVWNRYHGLPNVVYPNQELATLEAWKLAVRFPDTSFLVMESVDVRRFDLNGDEFRKKRKSYRHKKETAG